MEKVNELLASIAPADVTFLAGAGLSYDPPASLPTVNRFLRELLDACGAPADLAAQVLARSVVPPIPRFEGLVEEIAKLNDPELTLTRVFASRTFNELHSAVAAFLCAGSSVVTTNFDNCIEHATHDVATTCVVFDGRDLGGVPATRPLLAKPHGSHPLDEGAPRAQLVASIAAISMTSGGFALLPNWRTLLRSLFDDRVVVIIGYSGSDDFDLTPLLLESTPRVVIWICHDADGAERECDPRSIPHLERFAAALPLRSFVGSTRTILLDAARALGVRPAAGMPSPSLSVRDFVVSRFPSEAERLELLHLVFLYFGAYEAVLRPVPWDTPGLMLQQMKALFRLGRHDQLIELVGRLPFESMTPGEQFEAHYFHSSALSYMGRVDDAVREAEAAVEASAAHTLVGQMNALNQLGGTQVQAGHPDDAERAFEQALALQRERPHIATEATSKWGLASVYGMRNEIERSLGMFLQVRDVFRALGDDMNHGWADYNCADAYMNLGRPAEARACVASAEGVFRRLKLQMGIVYVLWLRARLHYRGGELPQCMAVLEELRAAGSQQGGFLWLLELALLFNCVRARLDQPAETFEHEPFAARLRALDRRHGRRLRRLLEKRTTRRIDAAEKWVFGGFLVRQ
jgi:tetratricopeptide (TPR) repeat protein